MYRRATPVATQAMGVMSGKPRRVRLTKKFAEFLDGIDLRRVKAGDDIELAEREARLLIAEGWAVRSLAPDRAVTDRRRRNARKKKRPRR